MYPRFKYLTGSASPLTLSESVLENIDPLHRLSGNSACYFKEGRGLRTWTTVKNSRDGSSPECRTPIQNRNLTPTRARRGSTQWSLTPNRLEPSVRLAMS